MTERHIYKLQKVDGPRVDLHCIGPDSGHGSPVPLGFFNVESNHAYADVNGKRNAFYCKRCLGQILVEQNVIDGVEDWLSPNPHVIFLDQKRT